MSRKTRKMLFALLAPIFLAAQLNAQPPVGLGDTVTIYGTVLESSMLPVIIPLAGARVIAYELQVSGPGGYQLVPLDTAFADDEGAYAMADVVTSGGLVRVTASVTGYFDSTASLPFGMQSDSVRINFLLRKIPANTLCLVNGRVVEASPNGTGVVPVAGATVMLTEKGGGMSNPTFTGTTDSLGLFSITASVDSAAMFSVYVIKTGYFPYSDSVALIAGDTVKLPDITLRPTNVPVVRLANATDGPFISASPNPFKSRVSLAVEGIACPGPYRVTVYNAAGKTVAFLNLEKSGSALRAVWDGRDVSGRLAAAGMYFAVVSTGKTAAGMEKIILK